MGKITRIRSVQYTHGPHQGPEKASGCSPIQFRKGFATYTAEEPVTEKTIKITRSWKLERIPQRSFSCSIIRNMPAKVEIYSLGT